MHMTRDLSMTASIELIGPHEAISLLSGNQGNRKIVKASIRGLVEDIRAGKWKVTHQGIALAPDGRLLDGQHRLTAIIEAGFTVPVMVARNVPTDTFEAIDRGTPRSISAVLGLDRNITDPCAFIARMHRTDSPIRPYHVQDVVDGVGSAVLDLIAETSTKARGRTSAAVKAAAALRILAGDKDKRYVLAQWRALVNLDFDRMSPCMKAFVRQVVDGSLGQGSVASWDRAARAWVAFDVRRAALSRIQINDVGTMMGEMRAVWRPSWVAPA